MTLKEYNERMIIGEPIYLNDNTAIEWILSKESEQVNATLNYMGSYGKLTTKIILQIPAELFEQESKELLLISENKKYVAILHRNNSGNRVLSTLYDIERFDLSPCDEVENDFKGMFFSKNFPEHSINNNYKVFTK